MNTRLTNILGIGPLTSSVFSNAGFQTFKDLYEFSEEDQTIYNAIQTIRIQEPLRSNSYWKGLMTRCINIINRIRDGKSYLPNVPEAFMCSETHRLMDEPVIIPGGYTYERDVIIAMIRDNGTNPNTGKPLTEDMLIPNLAIAQAIVDYRRLQTHYII